MKEQNLRISAGEVIVFTEGEYSDYGINGYMVARVDIDLGAELTAFGADGDYWSRINRFLAKMVAEEKMVPVKHREIHFDEVYGDGGLSAQDYSI